MPNPSKTFDISTNYLLTSLGGYNQAMTECDEQ